jgi:nicotinamide/nicotinate riboside kinase
MLLPVGRCTLSTAIAPPSRSLFLQPPSAAAQPKHCRYRGQMNSEGAFWKDPPGYFEQLVYPAYLDAHRSMFTVRDLLLPFSIKAALRSNGQDGDIEGGSPLLPGLVLIEPLRMSMDDIVSRCCGELVSVLHGPVATETGDNAQL